jgi:hypothetical protein
VAGETPEKLPIDPLKVLGKIVQEKRLSSQGSVGSIDFKSTYQAEIVARCENPPLLEKGGEYPGLLEVATDKKGAYYVFKVRIMEDTSDEKLGTSILPTIDQMLLPPDPSLQYEGIPDIVSKPDGNLLPGKEISSEYLHSLSSEHSGEVQEALKYTSVLLSLLPEAVLLKSNVKTKSPEVGDSVTLKHDRIEGRFYIIDAPTKKGQNANNGNAIVTSGADAPTTTKDPSDSPTAAAAFTNDAPPPPPPIPTMQSGDPVVVSSTKTAAVKNGEKVSKSVKCLERKGMTPEAYYQAEMRIFEKDFTEEMVDAERGQYSDERERRKDRAIRKYEKKKAEALQRKSMPSCKESK